MAARERRPTVTPVTLPRVVLAALAVALVPAALYPLTGPWGLLWVPLVLLVGGAVLLGRLHRRAPEPPPAEEKETRPAPMGNGRRLRTVSLPSAAADYDLQFSAVVHWRWSGHVDLRLRNPAGPAALAVVQRAAELARKTDPADEGMAECELAARLAVETAVIGSGIVVWAEEVSLCLAEGDAARLRQMADLRKDRELREAIRIAEVELSEAFASVGGPADELLGDLEPLDDEADPLPGPGSDVDSEGYESYWWPAEEGGDSHDSAERDVQVAILRGMIDSLDEGPRRASFARDQMRVLESGGFDEVARRVRAMYPDAGEREDEGSEGEDSRADR